MLHDLGNKSTLSYILHENYAYSLNDTLFYLFVHLYTLDLRPKLSSMSISAEGNTFRFVGEMGLGFFSLRQLLYLFPFIRLL